jgi:type II secretory pathway component PulF
MMIALILCIVGGIDEVNTKPSEILTGKRYTKFGVIIFLAVYLLLSALIIITMKDVSNAPRGEKRIYFAFLAAIPLLGSRMLFSLLSAFSNSEAFSIRGGKPLVQLFMAILEEFGVVVMYTLAGLTTSD